MNESKILNQRLSDLEKNYKKQEENQKINNIKNSEDIVLGAVDLLVSLRAPVK